MTRSLITPRSSFVTLSSRRHPSVDVAVPSTIVAASRDINSQLCSLTGGCSLRAHEIGHGDSGGGGGCACGSVEGQFSTTTDRKFAAFMMGWFSGDEWAPALSLTWFNFAFDWDYNCSRVKRIYTRNVSSRRYCVGEIFLWNSVVEEESVSWRYRSRGVLIFILFFFFYFYTQWFFFFTIFVTSLLF